MKVTVEFVIRDDKGNILSQNSPFPMEIGTQSLYDIEGCIEQMKNKVLPEIEVSLLTHAQKEFTEEAKKKLNFSCNGTRKVWIKTLHGKFEFQLQKYQINKKEASYFQLSEQLQERFVSPRLEELCGYYANRLSYENVAGLVERVTGENLLSDQTIWEIVKGKAETYSQQIRETVEKTLETSTSEQIQIKQKVEIYNAKELEILLFDDGIQVKGQKLKRSVNKESTADIPCSDTVKSNTPAIITDVAMLQTPKGEFEYLMAPLDDSSVEEPISLATVVKARILDIYKEKSKPLNIVAITDGAKVIRHRLLAIFGVLPFVILDWYHLCKKVRNLMSMIALNKQEKSNHVKFLLSQLWHGQTDIALNYLKHQVAARNHKVLLELIGYLEKHHSEIINYELRRKVGKSIGSGRIEKGVDVVVGHRQKKKGISWSINGSKALSLLKVAELNHDWTSLWVPTQSC